MDSSVQNGLPSPAPLTPAGAWSHLLTGPHPRLFGGESYLKARAVERASLYSHLQELDSPISAVCIRRVVEGIPEKHVARLLTLASDNVARGGTNEHGGSWNWMEQVGRVLDFCHDRLTPEARQEMYEWLRLNLDTFTDDENAFHNSICPKIRTYLEIAYGGWGENPYAQEFRDYALKKLYEGILLPVLLEFGDDGAWTEAPGDGRGAIWELVEALEMARRYERYDGFQLAPRFFYHRLAYEMLHPFPRKQDGAEWFDIEGDDHDTSGGWRTEAPRLIRLVLAQYFRGSELAGFVENLRGPGLTPRAQVADFLWDEGPQTPARDGHAFKTSHFSRGIGRVHARSHWEEDASWFRFECGPYFTAHQHLEVGNFTIFRNTPLATESGEYWDYWSNHDMNWLMRTIAHNCLLIHRPNDPSWKKLRDHNRWPYANDGGQMQKWEWIVPDLPTWLSRRGEFERGQIVAYENQPDYLYVAGECTAAYSPQKLKQWIRQIVFLRPHTFVVFDRVVSTAPEYQKTWLLHAFTEPKVQGDTALIVNGEGELHVQMLLPEARRVEAIHGYRYGGQDFEPETPRFAAIGNRWRLEVCPTEAQQEDLFLHVLSTDGPPQATLLREDGGVGVHLEGQRVLFTGEVGGQLARGEQSYTLAAEVKLGRFEK